MFTKRLALNLKLSTNLVSLQYIALNLGGLIDTKG